jgi:chemotaxis protein MotB
MRGTFNHNNNAHQSRPRKAKEQYQQKEGAWKLAYADFVTAMMCFFMLMWLLNTTPSQKLKSMATYFKPTIGFFSKMMTTEDEEKEIQEQTQTSSTDQDTTKSTTTESFNNVEAKIRSDLANDSYTRDLSSSISTNMSKDGLEISIFDSNKRPMFQKGSTQLTPEAKFLIEKITKSILYTPNRIVIGGYTEKTDNASINGYNTWDLSAGRAESARKAMQIAGLPQERIAKLVSYGDNVPFDDNDPYSPRNRRITITLMTRWSTVQYKVPISNSAISLDK